MAIATPIPFVKARFFDRCGKPLAGGKVYTYEPHSTTPKVTYTAAISGTPNTNPITLDAAGEADIYLAGRYRIIVKDAKDVLVNDNDDVGSWYSGDLDSQLESVNQYLSNTGDALAATAQARIDEMFNTGLVGAGSTDFMVALANGRTQRDKNAETVSVKDFGAIGDGTLHTVQEWYTIGAPYYRGFANLAAVQVQYPHVTAATDSIDWAATQKAVYAAPNVFCPKGKYMLNKVVKTAHNTTPYDLTTAKGVCIFGDGAQTAFTRSDKNEATRIYAEGSVYTTQASDEANLAEACFSVHSPYTQILDMTLTQSKIGIYLGQDYAVPFSSLSSVSKSNFANLQIDSCGTAILMLASGGNHYCSFKDIHFSHNQIDVHKRASNWWGIVQGRGDPNNNRNSFTCIRSARARIGLWNECGDTNSYTEWYGETMPSSSNTFVRPHTLPATLAASTCLFIFGARTQLNTMRTGFGESCEWLLHNDGYNNTFDTLLDEAKTQMIQPPAEWSGRYINRHRGIGYRDNNGSSQFPEISVAGALYIGLGAVSGVRNVANINYHYPANNLQGSFKAEFQIETGLIAATTPYSCVVWSQIGAPLSSTSSLDVDIVARCDVTGQISSFTTKLLITAYRASTRGIQRYGIEVIKSQRATSTNALDTNVANHIAATLSLGGTNDKDLILTITCFFAINATVFVRQLVQH